MDDIFCKAWNCIFFAKSIYLFKAISYVLWLNDLLYSAKLYDYNLYSET